MASAKPGPSRVPEHPLYLPHLTAGVLFVTYPAAPVLTICEEYLADSPSLHRDQSKRYCEQARDRNLDLAS